MQIRGKHIMLLSLKRRCCSAFQSRYEKKKWEWLFHSCSWANAIYSPILSLYLQSENAPVAGSIKYIGHLQGWSGAVVIHCVIILNKEWLFQVCHVFLLEVLTCITLGWWIIHWLWLTTLTGQETSRQISKSASPVNLLRQDTLLKFHLHFTTFLKNKIILCLHIKLPASQNQNSRYNKTINRINYRHVKYVSSVFFCHK